MNERRYERYAINDTENEKAKIVVIIEGTPVHVVNFSLGGLYVFSEKYFPEGAMVNLSIEFAQKDQINLFCRGLRASEVRNGPTLTVSFD